MTLNQPLKNDRRGAIMVIGVFFACMMIGWMWMLVGLGDAMIWRDRSQEAADAVTYSSAALQAQAMNLISFINILMLIMAAFYLLTAFIFNILDFLHWILGSTTDKACFPPPGDSSADSRSKKMQALSSIPIMAWLKPLASVWTKLAAGVEKIHDGSTNGTPSTLSVGGILDKYESGMIFLMPKFSDFEDLVSYAAPWGGTVAGIYMSQQYADYGQKRIGLALSASLIPATFTPGQAGSLMPTAQYKACANDECTQFLNCDSANPSSCQQYTGGDKREGLPVQIPNGGFKALCDYIGAKISSVVKNAFQGLGIPFLGTIMGWLMSFIGNQFSSNFCTQNAKGFFTGPEVADVFLRFTTAWTPPFGGHNNNEKCPKNDWGQGGGGATGGPKPCNGVYQMKLGNGKQFWQDPVDAGGPHLVVDYAMNGNDWFQVWGGVWGGNRDSSQAYSVQHEDKLVAVAGMQSNPGGTWNAGLIPQDTLSKWDFYLAQAEFYYDCDQAWSGSNCNSSSNASYNIGWRARLRRMHGLSWGQDLLGYMWNGSLGPNSGLQTRYQQFFKNKFGNGMASKLGSTITSAGLTWLVGQGASFIGGAINPASSVPDFIH
ncbi:MAG TPA: hypothetical protein VGH28_01355 [Polyangiaceae bacterium]